MEWFDAIRSDEGSLTRKVKEWMDGGVYICVEKRATPRYTLQCMACQTNQINSIHPNKQTQRVTLPTVPLFRQLANDVGTSPPSPKPGMHA